MKIDKIAAELLRQAEQTPGQIVRTKLERGLVLSLKNSDRHRYLAAARVDVYPSETEALIIARAFGVPPGTEPEWQVKPQRSALATLDWHGIVWHWLEDEPATVEQPCQAELLAAPASAY